MSVISANFFDDLFQPIMPNEDAGRHARLFEDKFEIKLEASDPCVPAH